MVDLSAEDIIHAAASHQCINGACHRPTCCTVVKIYFAVPPHPANNPALVPFNLSSASVATVIEHMGLPEMRV